MNPHFLFNSFNTLVSIIESNPKQAVMFVEHLSDFYRSILQYRDDDLILLKEEFSIMDNYIFLLKQRFGSSIVFDISDTGTEQYFYYSSDIAVIIGECSKT
ncbi:MAG: histidine kinase [Saprospiraceae bacterium]|nr:histidine kinase [Saprospiraceae bacterium]